MIGQYITVHGDVISHVNISHVMVEDGGEYSCIADNRAGKVSHSARLNVYGMYCLRAANEPKQEKKEKRKREVERGGDSARPDPRSNQTQTDDGNSETRCSYEMMMVLNRDFWSALRACHS